MISSQWQRSALPNSSRREGGTAAAAPLVVAICRCSRVVAVPAAEVLFGSATLKENETSDGNNSSSDTDKNGTVQTLTEPGNPLPQNS